MIRLGLLVTTLSLSGCFFAFDDPDDPPVCALATDDREEIAQAPLRNPDTLTCDDVGGGGCNPDCGPCPESTNDASATADMASPPGPAHRPTDLAGATRTAHLSPIPPLPSWNYCGHSCESLGESACAASPECRVVKDARCSIFYDCETDFVGCFPTDTVPDSSIDCERTFDAWDCSRSSDCTALHVVTGGRRSPQLERPFAMCISEGSSPGLCWPQVACDAAPPVCPSGTTPGVENACWTGGCIPLDICEPRPNE